MEYGPVLLTGATGFIGNHIAKRLVAAGIPVRYLLRRESDHSLLPDHQPADVRYGDLLDVFSLENALEGCNSIIHAAAKVSFLSKDAKEMAAVNEDGTANLVNAALGQGIKRFVHLSSVAALNRESGKLTTLKDRWHEKPAATAYARTKFAGEREVWRGQAEGLNVAVLYPSTVIGQGDWLRPGTPRLFHRAKNGIRFAPSGSAGFVAVDDVVNAVLFALKSDTENLRILLNAENLNWAVALNQIATAVEASGPSTTLSATASGFAWPISTLAARITGGTPKISRDLHLTASANYTYDGSSYSELTGQQYRAVSEVIQETGKAYLSEIKAIG